MAWDLASATETAAQVASGTSNIINQRAARGFSARTVLLANGTNQTLTFQFYLYSNGVNGPFLVLAFTLTAGASLVFGGGVAALSGGGGGTYTRTQGNEALVNAPADQYSFTVLQNAAAGGGNVTVDVIQQG